MGVLSRRRLTFVLAIGAFSASASMQAQYFPLAAPPDSPTWWTLDDSVTPEQLRTILQDPASSRERLRAAIESGRYPPLTEAHLSLVKFFHDPSADPALEPMWHAFHFFANYWLLEDGLLAATSDLASFGVSEEGTRIVLAQASSEARDFKVLVQELGPLQEQYIRTAWDLLERATRRPEERQRTLEIVQRRDAVAFAEAAGIPLEVAGRLADAAGRDPALEAALVALPILRSQLSLADWRGLRRYLLAQVASRLAPTMDVEGE